jgi:ribosomal-protein-alanine N-acetyltransferase
MELRTPRLILRSWRQDDLAPYAAMNADPEVRRWFLGTLSRAESDAQVAQLQAHIDTHGFGFWAVELIEQARLIGFVGLQHVAFAASFTPAVEIGWRLARGDWGRGYATEAARAALDDGFGRLGLAEIISFAVAGNLPSQRVMQRIGMRRDARADFDHPNIPEGHPFRRHVVYRIP